MNKTKRSKILIVDDFPNNLVALHSVFTGDSYLLIEAHSGEEALSVMATNDDISLVLLDVQMPGMDGFETAVRIKKIPGYREVPIIFLTAIFREDPFVKKGYEAGAIDYFSKPFDPDILKRKVDIYVSHRHKEQLLAEREKRIQDTEEILKAGRKLSTAFDNLPVGVMISDADGQVILSNHEVCRILTIDESELQNETIHLIERALKGCGVHNEMINIQCSDGKIKAVNYSASQLKNSAGEIFGAGIIIQDVTESKKIEEDLEKKILGLMMMHKNESMVPV